MSHMVLVTDYFAAYIVDTNMGTQIVPVDVCGKTDNLRNYVDGKILDVERKTGWFARYSAPGYLDCTEWCGPFATEEQAATECKETYGSEEDDNG